MAVTLSNQQLSRNASRIFHRYNFVVFILVVSIVIAVIIFSLSSLVQATYDMSSRQAKKAPTFDTKTIEALNDLQPAATKGDPIEFPSGRINPFAE